MKNIVGQYKQMLLRGTRRIIALAWVLALLTLGKKVIPIPGTKRMAYLEENAAQLSDDDMALLDALSVAVGSRYEVIGPNVDVMQVQPL